jgi:hypothetical protein
MFHNIDAIHSFRKALTLAPGDKRIQAELEILTETPSP